MLGVVGLRWRAFLTRKSKPLANKTIEPGNGIAVIVAVVVAVSDPQPPSSVKVPGAICWNPSISVAIGSALESKSA